MVGNRNYVTIPCIEETNKIEMNMEKMITIPAGKKAAVLAALYNYSGAQGMGWLNYESGDMTETEAAELLKKQSYFDYLKGRVMKVDLSKDEFDPRLYDRDNGDGAALIAVKHLNINHHEPLPKG